MEPKIRAGETRHLFLPYLFHTQAVLDVSVNRMIEAPACMEAVKQALGDENHPPPADKKRDMPSKRHVPRFHSAGKFLSRALGEKNDADGFEDNADVQEDGHPSYCLLTAGDNSSSTKALSILGLGLNPDCPRSRIHWL